MGQAASETGPRIEAETRAPATVRRYVASIVAAHRALGLERTVKSPAVRLALRRMHRKKGRRQDQAHGLTWPLHQRLMAAAGDRPIDDRNRALLAVAYDTLLRRTELVSLQVPDLLEDVRGDGSLPVRRARTDCAGRACRPACRTFCRCQAPRTGPGTMPPAHRQRPWVRRGPAQATERRRRPRPATIRRIRSRRSISR